ncbi:MAG: hypothetical protein M0017_05030 [Desulfobacteraceae bacterium]|nr:hypothetical protein [Desulfobacteraceae bacterium]
MFDSLKWIVLWGGLLLLGGCAADLQTPLVHAKMSLSSPHSEERVPVIYPDEQRQQEGSGDPMVDAYGPAWRDLQGRYPEYQFN